LDGEGVELRLKPELGEDEDSVQFGGRLGQNIYTDNQGNDWNQSTSNTE
jgi:hypothetical protein